MASQASSSPWPNSEGYFSASSQCKLPRSELEKGVTKVWVTVHHIALKQPITRETRGERNEGKSVYMYIIFKIMYLKIKD